MDEPLLPPSISQDDLMDVMEMTDALEKHMSDILDGNQNSLALSALMSASINCMMSHCKTLNEIILFRNIFIQTMDTAISGIQIKNSDQ